MSISHKSVSRINRAVEVPQNNEKPDSSHPPQDQNKETSEEKTAVSSNIKQSLPDYLL